MTEQSSDPTVLIVEDERHLADLYATWLADSFAVRTAYDGESGLEQYDDAVDVVLLDRRMPGMSGDDVLEELRSRAGDSWVVMVTAVEPDFDIIDMGFDDYVVKPVDREELNGIVERMLKRSTYSKQVRDLQSLMVKRAALEAEKNPSELEQSEEYAELVDRIEHLKEQTDSTLGEFDSDDFEAAFRELGSGDDASSGLF